MVNSELISKAVSAAIAPEATKPSNMPQKGWFIWDASTDDVTSLLLAAYRIEVERRGSYDYQATQEVTDTAGKIAVWLTDTSRKAGLMLMGGVGNGKSTWLQAIIRAEKMLVSANVEGYHAEREAAFGYPRELAEQTGFPYSDERDLTDEQKQWIAGHPEAYRDYCDRLNAHRQNWSRIMDEIEKKYSQHKKTKIQFATALQIADTAVNYPDSPDTSLYRRCPMLAVDDLGVEPVVANRMGTRLMPLTELLLARYDEGRPVIIATNKTPDEIASTYGQRIWDRLREGCERIALTAPSFRK